MLTKIVLQEKYSYCIMLIFIYFPANNTDSTSEEMEACGESGPKYLFANSNYQTIVSPNYPNDYPTNSNCTWFIYGFGERITVRYIVVQLEDG